MQTRSGGLYAGGRAGVAGGPFQALHGQAGGDEPVQAAQAAAGFPGSDGADGEGAGGLCGENAL